MSRNSMYQLFLAYLAIILFGTIWLSLKFLSDLSDCNMKNTRVGVKSNVDVHANSDPWNINDHSVSFDHDVLSSKEKRNIPDSITDPVQSSKTKEKIEDIIKEDNKKLVSETDEDIQSLAFTSPHRLAIIVPYRDRFEELRIFVPHMHKYLTEKAIDFKIYIINQADKHRFNRASLINVGFLIARNDSFDYIAMHDVDLLPLNKDLNYGYPDNGPFHVAAPHLHPKYHYKTFVGGILILSVEQFEEVNGLSNKFWGWGREDDELYMRMTEAGYMVQRHGMEIDTGYHTFQHEHDSEKRPRDYKRLPGQKKVQFSRDRETGFNNVRYQIKSKQSLSIDSYPCTVVDVHLVCDVMTTPWCNFPAKSKRKH